MAKKQQNEALVIPIQGDSLPGVGRIESPDDLAEVLAGPGELLPEIHTLEEGSYVQGKIEGPGQEVDYTDPEGNERILRTWRFRLDNGLALDVIESHQLGKALPLLIGHRVTVLKGKAKSIGARRVNKFVIKDHGKA